MEMSGERVIEAEKSTVWTALNDPEVLKACIPGCQSMERTEDGGFAATVKQKVGPVSATFKGSVTLEDVVEGESYKLVGEGKGGAAGFAKGGADVKLEEVEGGTKLSYVAEAKVGGKIAQLGSRLIDGFAKKMADQFFDTFKATVEGPPAEATPEAETVAEVAVDTASDAATSSAASVEEAATSATETVKDAVADAAGAVQDAAAEAPKKKSWLGRLFGG